MSGLIFLRINLFEAGWHFSDCPLTPQLPSSCPLKPSRCPLYRWNCSKSTALIKLKAWINQMWYIKPTKSDYITKRNCEQPTANSSEPKHQKRQAAYVSLEILLAGWRWDRSGGACCKDNPLSSHCVSSSAPGLKTTRLVTMKLLFQMTAPPGNRRLPVPIWSKYGVGWSRYAPPFFVFSTIDAPSKGHWVRVVNNVRCA